MLRKPSHALFVFYIAFLFFAAAIQLLKKDRPEATAETTPVAYSSTPVSRSIRMKVTAYCLCEKCCGKWARIPRGKRKTAAGDDPFIFDGVAADFKLLPKRTRLKIPEIGIREVDDTGGAMRQDAKRGIYHIDIRFPTHQQALNWGVQWLNVTVLPSQ